MNKGGLIIVYNIKIKLHFFSVTAKRNSHTKLLILENVIFNFNTFVQRMAHTWQKLSEQN